MLNDEAFISEIDLAGYGEGNDNEYIEITIRASADLSDYTVGFYDAVTGDLTGGYVSGAESAGSSFFPSDAEFTLQDVQDLLPGGGPTGSVTSSVGGLSLSITVHPDDPDFYIVTIPYSGINDENGASAFNNVSLVTLSYTDPSTSTVTAEAYNSGTIKSGSVTTVQDGVAAGTTIVATGGPTSQMDYLGNITNGTETNLDSVICFTVNTLMLTRHKNVPIQTLSIGDQVRTLGNGDQPIRWIGNRKFSARELASNPKLRPVVVMAGALGQGLPKRDLVVSRQHRMVISSKIAERMFGVSEVLVPAIKLIELPGIFIDKNAEEVEYFHVLFDQHEVIFAEGAPSESLYTGPEALKAVSHEARAEILTIFPELEDMDYSPVPALTIPVPKQQKNLIARHAKNKNRCLELYPKVGDGCHQAAL